MSENIFVVLKYLRGILFLALLLLLISPFLFLRLVAILTAPLFKRNFGRVLSASSCIFAVDPIYTKPKMTLILMIKFEEKVELSTIRKSFERVLGSGKYPELHQKLSRWIFTYFWEDCGEDFSLDDHIKLEHKAMENDTDFQAEFEITTRKPFTEGKPLWEIILYENENSNGNRGGSGGSFVTLRIHHCLADGFSLLNLLNDLSDSKTAFEKLATRKFTEPSWVERIRFFMELIFTGPETVLREMQSSEDVNDWRIPPEKRTGKETRFESQEVTLEFVKAIAKKRNVRLSAVLLAGITGAARNLMLKMGHKIPQDLTVFCPMPLPNHPDFLTNHLTMVSIKAPVSIPDPFRRLQNISLQFESLQRSILPSSFASFIKILGLFSSIFQSDFNPGLGTIFTTNFPGPELPLKIFGAPAAQFSFSTGMAEKGSVVGIATMSYNGRIFLTALSETGLLSQEDTEEFVKFMVQELQLLQMKD